MAKTTQNHSWSELTHDVLFLIMMPVTVFDFVAFSGVCKSWRSLAVLNKKKFIKSKPPMSMWIHRRRHRGLPFREDWCYLEDSEGRKTKIALRHSACRTLVGFTCGYLVMFGRKTCDFWLLNPITKHGLHFPDFPFSLEFDDPPRTLMAILVFSPSMCGWVFVIGQRQRHPRQIWYTIAGKGKTTWNCFDSIYPIVDLHAFKGKIYTIDDFCQVCELRLIPKPRQTLLNTTTTDLKRFFLSYEIVSFIDNLYVVGCRHTQAEYSVVEVDIDQMKWVQEPKITVGYTFLVRFLKHGAYAIKGFHHLPQYAMYPYFHGQTQKDSFYKMRYYTHDCMNVDIIHDS